MYGGEKEIDIEVLKVHIRGVLWSVKSAAVPNSGGKKRNKFIFYFVSKKIVTCPCLVIFISMIIVNMM